MITGAVLERQYRNGGGKGNQEHRWWVLLVKSYCGEVIRPHLHYKNFFG